MRLWSRAVILVAALSVACAPGPPSPEVVKGEIASFLEGYLAAISSRDTVTIRSAYVTDDRFVWIEDGAVQYRRVDDLLAGLASLPAASPIRTDLADLEVVPLGRHAAHAWASFTTTVGDEPLGFSFSGVLSFTLEHDGTRWKIVGGHTSSLSRR